ncbi:MAG: hypothetical protein ACRDQZ_26955 [Mycobacteriales bacterium]
MTMRIAAAIVATVGLATLAAACGGAPESHVAQLGTTATQSSPTSTGSASRPSAVTYSTCMRSRGVSKFPDPDSSGQIPKVGLQELGVSSSQFQTAQTACQHLLSNSGQSSQAQVQTVMNALTRFARCVRSHGVSNWPDPLAESDPGQPGTPGFPRNMPGVDQNSPIVRTAMNQCQHLLAGIGYASGGYP